MPAPRVVFDGPLVARGFLGGTGRANAACSLDPSPDPDLAARVARVEADYARWGLPTRFRLTPLDPPGLRDLLLARGGYEEEDGAVVMAGPLAPLARPADGRVSVLAAPDAAWLAVTATAEHQTEARRAEKLASVPLLARPAAWAVARLGDGGEEPVAVAHAVADGRLCGIFDVATDPRHRRRGHAGRAMAALAAWAAGQGAEVAWLQVGVENAAARALYARLGLREVYCYAYLVRRRRGAGESRRA